MSERRWYSPLLALAVVTITAGAIFSVAASRGWRVAALVTPKSASSAPVARAATKKAPPVAPVAQPAVPKVSVPKASVPDAAVVQSGVPRVSAPRARPKWAPSDRQRLRDRVYLAGKENRSADAIAYLEEWDAKHPGDPEVLRELARLLARSPKAYDAFSRYRELLAVQPDTSVRAEYASALLAMQQYDSAAANFRILIDVDTANVAAHLGLARALSWSNHPKEAEPELSWLLPRMPGDTVLPVMLHVARASYDPTVEQAQRWVAEDPSYSPYRVALARAFVREGHERLAVEHFDAALAANEHAPASLIREAAGAHAAAGDSVGTARLLRGAVAAAPGDARVRADYADALAWSGDRQGAIAQYDTLLTAKPDADFLIARGRLYALSGNNAVAQRDLSSANALRESAGTWVMIGDLYRWRGDRVRAREAYAHAAALHPGEVGAVAGVEALAEADRRDVAAILAHELTWALASSYLGDNQGFSLYWQSLNGGVGVGERTALTVGVDAQRLDSLNGASGRLGLVQHVGRFRLAGEGGLLHYAQLGDFGFGSFSLAGPWGRTWFSSDLRTGPAYQPLMTAGRLTYTGADIGLTIPLGAAAFSAGVDQMWLSDGNTRTALQIGARYHLGYGVSAVYSGGVVGFDHASALYWDPRRFSSHALGVEVATHSDSGFSFSARVLPGIGVNTELLSGRSDPNQRNAAQLSSGFAIDYRRRWWALTFDGDYAQGVRQSGYHSARASVRVRITP